MAGNGPPPTPTAILDARGSRKAKTRPKEPKPESGRPRCPAWMSKPAKAVWKEVVSLLDDMNVLTKADGLNLRRYCYMVVSWRRCQEFVDKHGETYPQKDAKGEVIAVRAFPQTKLLLELNDRLLKAEREFGLTPSARTRLEVIGPDTKSDVDKRAYFRGTG